MTLLSIIGDDISRIIPVLYAYKDKIKHHVLLCDDDPSNMERAKTLQQGMQNFSVNHALGWYTRIISTNEDSAASIKESAKRAFDTEETLWLNATDGYPAITILLSEMVRQEGGKVLSYDHFDNDLHVIEPDGTMVTKQLEAKMDIESYITLLNYSLVSQVDKNTLKKRKKAIMELYRVESNYRKVREALIYPETSRYDVSMFKDTMEALRELGIVDSNYNYESSKRKELEGDLLEEYIFWLCVAMNPDDIAMGMIIGYEGTSDEKVPIRRVSNEFDVLLMQNNRLHVIECKNRKNFNGLDAIYKYDSIINEFGIASKAIVVNISNNPKEEYIGMNQSKNFAYSTLRRARRSGISVYHESQVNVIKFQNLVRNFFHIS